MNVSRAITVWLVLLLAAGLTGCAASKEEPVLNDSLTWEDAKAETQAVELELASLVPSDVVVRVEQMEEGGLFSCDESQHNWSGATTITVKPGTEIEPIVRQIEAHYQDDARFATRNRLDIVGNFKVQLMSPKTAESYLVSEDDADTIRIASVSACFTLPEGVYPGGSF